MKIFILKPGRWLSPQSHFHELQQCSNSNLVSVSSNHRHFKGVSESERIDIETRFYNIRVYGFTPGHWLVPTFTTARVKIWVNGTKEAHHVKRRACNDIIIPGKDVPRSCNLCSISVCTCHCVCFNTWKVDFLRIPHICRRSRSVSCVKTYYYIAYDMLNRLQSSLSDFQKLYFLPTSRCGHVPTTLEHFNNSWNIP